MRVSTVTATLFVLLCGNGCEVEHLMGPANEWVHVNAHVENNTPVIDITVADDLIIAGGLIDKVMYDYSSGSNIVPLALSDETLFWSGCETERVCDLSRPGLIQKHNPQGGAALIFASWVITEFHGGQVLPDNLIQLDGPITGLHRKPQINLKRGGK